MTLMVVLAAFRPPGEAAAQTAGNVDPPRAEIWGAWAVAMPISNGTVDVAYEPPMRLGGTPLESRARQVLNVEAGAGYGLDLGVNVFFNRALGLQGAFTATSANVSGTNGDYDTFLRYISSQPPDYQPREYTCEQSTPWARTTGTLGYRSLAIGGVVRWRTATGRAGGTLAGGVDIDWFTGELESVGYTQFILGGHSTLFSVTHRVLVRPSTGERSFGPYVGGDVHVAIARRVAIMAGVRIRLTSGRARTIQVVDLVDPDESTWVPGLPEVAAALDGQPLELPGMRWRTLVGVKLFVR
jgi:hypothetical protein